MRPPHSIQRIVLAFFIAIAADLVQLPLTALLATGVFSVIAELAILAVDAGTILLLVATIGFDWLLIPAFAFEAIPVADAAPAWVLCTALVVWKRFRGRFPLRSQSQEDYNAPHPPIPARLVVESSEGPVIDGNPASREADPIDEERFAGLKRLLARGLITQAEFDARRRDILSQL